MRKTFETLAEENRGVSVKSTSFDEQYKEAYIKAFRSTGRPIRTMEDAEYYWKEVLEEWEKKRIQKFLPQ